VRPHATGGGDLKTAWAQRGGKHASVRSGGRRKEDVCIACEGRLREEVPGAAIAIRGRSCKRALGKKGRSVQRDNAAKSEDKPR